MLRHRFLPIAGATLLAVAGTIPAQAGGGHHGGYHGHHGYPHSSFSTVIDGLDGPRGVATVWPGRTLVSESDGTFSLVTERRHRAAKVKELGSVPPGFAPALDANRHGVFLLTGAGDEAGAATLYRWKPGDAAPTELANIAKYQGNDPDPYNLENPAGESNPFGVAALKDGSVLVADAAGNDLLRVHSNGDIETVARLKPRVVKVPEGLPATDPEGNSLPPAGTPIGSEAVATSVTVGNDGYWYVGELRGFPATPGTSQIWRIKPGSVDAVCDPEKPWKGACKRYSDGLTSVVDLAADPRRGILALSLSKMSWLQMELGTPGAEVGGLFNVRGHGHRIKELARNKLVQPGGVAASRWGSIYVTSPVFGPGALYKIRESYRR